MMQAKVTGIPDMRQALAGIPAKLRVRALRNALAAGARVVQKAARGATPEISATALAVRKGYRKPGTVKKAIRVRTSKVAKKAGDVGVFVNVRPAKGSKFRGGLKVRASQRGAKSPNDPYYWRWLNFGAKHMRAFNFLDKGAQQLPQALQVFLAKIVPQIEKLNKPGAPAP